LREEMANSVDRDIIIISKEELIRKNGAKKKNNY